MLDFDDNQELHEQALYRFQRGNKWQKGIVLKVNDDICPPIWDEFLYKLPMNQHQKKEYLKSMNQVLHLVFRKTSNHQSNLELPKQVF